MNAPKQFCTFFLNKLFFGVEVEKVQEVIRYQEMTKMPQAPEVIRGLINLRGQIVTAIDLKRRLGLDVLDENGKENLFPMNVVVRTDEAPVSFLVDEIGNVLELEEDCFERPPETLTGMAKELIRGAYKLKDRLLLVLDMEKTMQLEGAKAE